MVDKMESGASLPPPEQERRPIATYVFMDLESTSLLDDKKCRITELSMIAVNTVDFDGSDQFPRVTNKLTICLDPQRPVSATSSHITGLYNDSLEHQKSFTEDTIKLLNAFLNHLNKPVCLLAHNGNRFDFPLIVSELKRVNQILESSLLCADTLEAFRSLDGLPAKYEPSANQVTDSTPQSDSATPERKNVTPADSKALTASTQSPLKRKSTSSLTEDAQKVKKKLDFQAVKTGQVAQASSIVEKNITIKSEEETAHNTDHLFSGSLEDTDYLTALAIVENDLKNAAKPVSTSSVTNKPETSSPAASTSGMCSVANGTGYYVRSSETRGSTTCSTENGLKIGGGDKYDNKVSVQLTTTTTTTNTTTTTSHGKTNNALHLQVGQKEMVITGNNSLLPVLNASLNPQQNNCPVKGISPSTKSVAPKDLLNITVNNDRSKITTNSAEIKPDTKYVKETIVGKPYESLAKQDRGNESPQLLTENIAAVSVSNNTALIGQNSSILEKSNSNHSPSFLEKTKVNNFKPEKGALTKPVEQNTASSIKEQGLFEPVPGPSHVVDSPSLSQASAVIINNSGTRVLESSNTRTPTTNPRQGTPITPRRQSYRLGEIYYRQFGCRPQQSHKAEDDCVTLLRVAKCTPGFVEWVNQNAVLLSTIDAPF